MRVDAETGEKSYWVSVTTDEGTSEQPLESSMGNDLTSSLKGKFAVWLAKTFITDDGQTIGGVAGTFVSDIIVAVVMFVVYCLALGLVCWLLRKIFAKMHTSDSKALVAVDRTFGAVISVAFAFVFILWHLQYSTRSKTKSPPSTKLCPLRPCADIFTPTIPLQNFSPKSLVDKSSCMLAHACLIFME